MKFMWVWLGHLLSLSLYLTPEIANNWSRKSWLAGTLLWMFEAPLDVDITYRLQNQLSLAFFSSL